MDDSTFRFLLSTMPKESATLWGNALAKQRGELEAEIKGLKVQLEEKQLQLTGLNKSIDYLFGLTNKPVTPVITAATQAPKLVADSEMAKVKITYSELQPKPTVQEADDYLAYLVSLIKSPSWLQEFPHVTVGSKTKPSLVRFPKDETLDYQRLIKALDNSPERRKILGFIHDNHNTGFTPYQIEKGLEFKESQSKNLRQTLMRMAADGQLDKNPSGIYFLPGTLINDLQKAKMLPKPEDYSNPDFMRKFIPQVPVVKAPSYKGYPYENYKNWKPKGHPNSLNFTNSSTQTWNGQTWIITCRKNSTPTVCTKCNETVPASDVVAVMWAGLGSEQANGQHQFYHVDCSPIAVVLEKKPDK